MRRLLQIGEVAQLLGVTTKTIRYYHKRGLLQEPERTAAGYRLYSAQDLLRLKQIRQLQTLGLALHQIKTILGEPTQPHTLREVLQSLDDDLTQQITELTQQQLRLRSFLQEEEIGLVQKSKTLEWLKELQGERLSRFAPWMLEIETKLWEVLQNFAWPDGLHAQMRQMAEDLTAQPEAGQMMEDFYARLGPLIELPADAPELEQLIEEMIQDPAMTILYQQITEWSGQITPLGAPYADALGGLMGPHLTPALHRLFNGLQQLLEAKNMNNRTQDKNKNGIQIQ